MTKKSCLIQAVLFFLPNVFDLWLVEYMNMKPANMEDWLYNGCLQGKHLLLFELCIKLAGIVCGMFFYFRELQTN